ncbi:MAG: hypothetical protein OCC49_19325 [Fibrobacterales bacterium]
MKVSQSKFEIIESTLGDWREADHIDTETYERLLETLEPEPFDWKRLAKYSFWISIICVVISLTSVVADGYLRMVFQKLFDAPALAKSITFFVIALGSIAWTKRLQLTQPLKTFRNESLLFVGVLCVAVSIAFLGQALDTGSGHFSLLILIASCIYAVIGLWLRSELTWIFSLIAFCGWLGAETGYASGWGAYYLGMNYPMRFVVMGTGLLLTTVVFKRVALLDLFSKSTRVIALLNLFIALWILSIFGNHGSLHEWELVTQFELVHWALLFGVVALGSIYHGLKNDDSMTRGFGITFLFINFYTRFFEYLWDTTHKALLFAILAVTFWVIGAKAESIWNVGRVKDERNNL